MATELHILGISGSLRKASFNTGLLRAAGEVLPAGVRLTIADISAIPLYNGDLDGAEQPEPVQEFKAQIAAADALLIATPEYNYSFPGVLKNAIDWAARPITTSPLAGKPAALMGAGGRFGTVRAQLQLRQVALYVNMLMLNKPELMVPAAWEKFDEQGRLTDDAVRKQVADLVAALAGWAQRLRG
jgi:chromate reductase